MKFFLQKASGNCKTLMQQEALLNEYKGNIFEFLVGKEISIHYGREFFYLDRIPKKFLKKLAIYEDYIRRSDRELFESLPLMARKSFEAAKESLPSGPCEIFLVGKLVGGSNDKSLGEADLLLKRGSDIVLLGLKLCRKGSFVNTKSGGVKSFFIRYFSLFEKASFFQERVNRALKTAFEQMAQTLYEINDLEFTGCFDEKWADSARPFLPGELDSKEKDVVLTFYYRLIREFHEAFSYFLRVDRECFRRCLSALLGVSRKEMIQITTFYDRTALKKYIFDQTIVENWNGILSDLTTLEVLPLKNKRSSFEVAFPPHRLQIRLKPMNTFTIPGLKVNCSRKFSLR